MEESPPAPAAEPVKAPALSAEERMANLLRLQRARRRKGFLIGLVVGQGLIIAMDFGGELILKLLSKRIQFSPPPGLSLRGLVFMGMTAGIVLTGLLIFFILGLSGAGYVFGNKKKAGFVTAIGRGMKRVFKAAWAVGLTLGVIGGTSWFLIPRNEWKPTAGYLEGQGRKAVDGTKDWLKRVVTPPPKEENK